MPNEVLEKYSHMRIMPIINGSGKPKKLQHFKADIFNRNFRPYIADLSMILLSEWNLA